MYIRPIDGHREWLNDDFFTYNLHFMMAYTNSPRKGLCASFLQNTSWDRRCFTS